MKKVNACSDGGFLKLQAKLLSGSDGDVKCVACRDLLDKHWTRSDFEAFLVKWLHSEIDIEQKTVQKGHVVKGQDAEEGQQQDGLVEQAGHQDEEKKDETLRAEKQDRQKEALAWLWQFQQVISILPPGAFVKKHGYRCNVCKTKKSPEGRVGELDELRLNTVQHFLKQHLKSSMRLKYLRKSENHVPQTTTDCEALCISHSSAGKLYELRVEFNLWAGHANLAGTASHKYWFDASGGSWFLRSRDCDGQTGQHEGAERQICNRCLQLTLAQSVSGLCHPVKVFCFAVGYLTSSFCRV